jgi:tetratricopeptide (TPR) repeat protein
VRRIANSKLAGRAAGVRRASLRVRRRVLACAAALGIALAAAPALARDDAALARANALLAEKEQWPQAIEIYRALLAEDASWIEPRHQLARVQAWRGEYAEALEHYDRLAADPAPPPGLAIERAEVLSWAGRSAEAALAFESILQGDPDEPRAARGLARVHRWSGARSRADRWYTRALELEDDAEARSEQQSLRAELRREIGASARAFFDSEDFSYFRSEARAALDWDFDTRLYATSATLFVDHRREPGAPLGGAPEDLRGFEGRLGVERRLGLRAKGFVELGGRHWDHADAVPLARGGLELSPGEATSIGFEVAYDDLLERSYSLESVLENVRRTGAKLSAWRQLTPALEGYAEAGGGWLDDSNRDLFAGASFAWKPFAAHEVRLALALDASRYAEHSDLYYSPELDAGTTLSLAGKIPLAGPLALTFDVGGGAGVSHELGSSELGPAYRAKLGLAWRRGGFALDVEAGRSTSQRAIAYTTHELSLRASWSF